ncbi:MAG: hypothetical protein AAF288_02910 [Planctomycetota bacterium]
MHWTLGLALAAAGAAALTTPIARQVTHQRVLQGIESPKPTAFQEALSHLVYVSFDQPRLVDQALDRAPNLKPNRQRALLTALIEVRQDDPDATQPAWRTRTEQQLAEHLRRLTTEQVLALPSDLVLQPFARADLLRRVADPQPLPYQEFAVLYVALERRGLWTLPNVPTPTWQRGLMLPLEALGDQGLDHPKLRDRAIQQVAWRAQAQPTDALHHQAAASVIERTWRLALPDPTPSATHALLDTTCWLAQDHWIISEAAPTALVSLRTAMPKLTTLPDVHGRAQWVLQHAGPPVSLAVERRAQTEFDQAHLDATPIERLIDDVRQAVKQPRGAPLAVACLRLADAVVLRDDPAERDTLRAFAGELLTRYDDRARLAGAALVGLTDVAPTRVVGPLDRLNRLDPPISLAQAHALPDEALPALGLERVDALRHALRIEPDPALRFAFEAAERLRQARPFELSNATPSDKPPAALPPRASLARLPADLQPLAWALRVRLNPCAGWQDAFPRTGPAAIDVASLTRTHAGAELIEHLSAGRAPRVDPLYAGADSSATGAGSPGRTMQILRLGDWTRLGRPSSLDPHEPTRPDAAPDP